MQFLCFFSFPSQVSRFVLRKPQLATEKTDSRGARIIGTEMGRFDKISCGVMTQNVKLPLSASKFLFRNLSRRDYE
jgi:hypothetical protein